MKTTDNAIINLPLSKRGNIDVQIDAYKKYKENSETKEFLGNILHLCKGGMIRSFANRTQAENAALRTGGEAYQSPRSRKFLVRFN